jgi:dTDP-4-dehydrorhamnose reductase
MARTFRRPLVVGGTGQLGHDLVEAFSDTGAIGLSHEQISIEDAASVAAALRAHEPDIVLNTAAFHNVPTCETQQRRAFAVNGAGVQNLAQACYARGIPFLTLSTDYVFDGTKGSAYTEEDEPHPLSVYGMTKFAGEMLALAASPQTFVVRTSGLFGAVGSKSKGYTFIDRILQQARDGQEIRVVSDMTFSPSYTRDVASGIRSIVERGAFGIYHVTNSGFCTWYEFACEALAQAGLDVSVSAISSAEWFSNVRRPMNSSLAHPRLAQQGLPQMPPWQAGITAYLRARGLGGSGVSTPLP